MTGRVSVIRQIHVGYRILTDIRSNAFREFWEKMVIVMLLLFSDYRVCHHSWVTMKLKHFPMSLAPPGTSRMKHSMRFLMMPRASSRICSTNSPGGCTLIAWTADTWQIFEHSKRITYHNLGSRLLRLAPAQVMPENYWEIQPNHRIRMFLHLFPARLSIIVILSARMSVWGRN